MLGPESTPQFEYSPAERKTNLRIFRALVNLLDNHHVTYPIYTWPDEPYLYRRARFISKSNPRDVLQIEGLGDEDGLAHSETGDTPLWFKAPTATIKRGGHFLSDATSYKDTPYEAQPEVVIGKDNNPYFFENFILYNELGEAIVYRGVSALSKRSEDEPLIETLTDWGIKQENIKILDFVPLELDTDFIKASLTHHLIVESALEAINSGNFYLEQPKRNLY